jgi:hypothetical protein
VVYVRSQGAALSTQISHDSEQAAAERGKKVAPQNYTKMKEKQLQEACKQRGLATTGKKGEMVKRLKQYDKD